MSDRPKLFAGAGVLWLAALFFPVDALVGALLGHGSKEVTFGVAQACAQGFRSLLALHGCALIALAYASPREPTPAWRPPPDAAATGWSGQEKWILVALVAAGALLRAIHLDTDLWHDELFTWLDLVKLPFLRIATSYPDDNQHLIYSLAARAATQVLGENPAALRLPAVILGVASLWTTARLGRLLLPAPQALFATALLALSYHHVWFSQNARGYTGLLLATTLASELLLRVLARPRWRTALAYGAVLAFGMGVHLTMAFVVAAHGLAVLVLLARAATRGAALRACAGLVLAGTLTLQIYCFALPELIAFYSQPAAGATQADVVWKNPLWLVAEGVRSLGIGAAGWAALSLAALPFGVGALRLARRAPLAALLALGPSAVTVIALLALSRNLWPRFFFSSFSLFALIAMSGVWALASWLGTRLRLAWLAPATCALVVAASAATLPRAYQPKQDFSGARDWVRAQAAPGDRIVGLDLAGEAFRAYYAPEFALAFTREELEAVQAERGRSWILYSFGGYIEAREPALWRLIEERYEEVRAFPGTLGGGAIVVRRSRE